jgi:hypothetical protein
MELKNSFDKTKLSLENPLPSSLNRLDTSTVFNPNSTGTPSNTANPGAPSPFFQKYVPNETYLQYVKDLPNKSNLLNLNTLNSTTERFDKYTIFDATNLDIEKPGVDGGIPYKQEKDPTVYPPSTQKITPSTGTFAIPGKGATKYNQSFFPTKTYTDFIKKSI